MFLEIMLDLKSFFSSPFNCYMQSVFVDFWQHLKSYCMTLVTDIGIEVKHTDCTFKFKNMFFENLVFSAKTNQYSKRRVFKDRK